MRRLAVWTILLALPTFAAELRFQSPTQDSPCYRIRLAYEIRGAPRTIRAILLNGSSFAPTLVYRSGKPVDLTKALKPGLYDIVLDYAWSGGMKYSLTVRRREAAGAREKSDTFSGTSPAEGGIPPAGREGFHRVYRILEEAGIPRENEICYLTLTADRSELEQPEFVLYEGAAEIPYQILARKESDPPQGAALSNPRTVTYKIAFPQSLGPGDKKLLLVLRGKPGRPSPGGIVLAGDGLGRSLQTPFLSLTFHPQSGQVLTIETPGEGIRLWNKAGVIHWNPDVFIPGLAWDHAFDWNPPRDFEEAAGSLVYLNARGGPLPRIKDVDLEVRYAVDAFHPHFIAETRMSFHKDLGVIAVRNDEMVLFKELFDSLMYRDTNGEVVVRPLKEKAEQPFGLVHVAPPDVPWAGLVNTGERFGIFSLRLESAVSCLGAAGDFRHKPGTYFYAPSDGDYVYWVRPLLYTWAEYATNAYLTAVPKGSFFYEKNAYVILRLTGETPRELDALLQRLRNPLRVF